MKYAELSLAELNAVVTVYTAEGTPVPVELTAAIEAKKMAKPDDQEEADEEGTDEEDDNEDDENPDGSKKKKTTAYKHVSALVPAGEHFAIEALNEGVWLTVAHLSSIETNLQAQSKAVLVSVKKAANATASLTETQSQLATANDRIKALEAENITLKAADGKTTATAPVSDADPVLGEQKPSLATAKTKWDLEIEKQQSFISKK